MFHRIWAKANSIKRHEHTVYRRSLQGLGIALLVAGSSIGLHPLAHARDTKMVTLRYDGVRATVPLKDIQALTSGNDISEELQAYFNATPITPEDGAAILNGEIYDGGIPIKQNDAEFLAIQISRIIGDPLGRERADDMFDTLRVSFMGDRTITFLEIVENYPDANVRVDFKRLDRLRTDVLLFVERISPVLDVIEELLPELVCDCGFEEATTDTSRTTTIEALPLSPSHHHDNDVEHQAVELGCPPSQNAQAWKLYHGAIAQLKSIANPSFDDPATTTQQRNSFIAQEPLIPLSLNGTSRIPTPIAETIILSVGPIRPSFAISDLDNFVETGRIPNGWKFYFSVAGINAEEFRTALTQEVEVDVMFIDDWLNNILGEYLLFEAGKIIHKPSESSNIQALRSAIILSAIGDGKISLLEFLRNYPSTTVVVEALNLARFGRNLSNQGVVGTATAGLEDLLLELQSEVADDICDCDANE